jgi:lipid A ethanolaminephosphotransferase
MTPSLPRTISATMLTLTVCVFILATENGTFWGHARRIFAGDPLALVTFGMAILLLMVALSMAFTQRWLVKPYLIFLLLVAASASHFLERYGIYVDREMIQNVVSTTSQEAGHLLTMGLFGDMVIFGVMPALAVAMAPLKQEVFWGKMLRNGAIGMVSLAGCLGLLLTDFGQFASVFREQKELMASFQPGAPISGAIRYAKLLLRTRNLIVVPYGTDATAGPQLAAADRPVVMVLIVGETGRAQNWALNGYARATSPELSAREISYFSDVSSCGTSTAVSVPCMFSGLGRDGYSYGAGLARENLMDVLAHAGFRTMWWDNNGGSQRVAVRMGEEALFAGTDAEICPAGECDDRILLQRLAAELPKITENTVIVLHTIGSHGPSYHLRYPADRAVFTPTCETGELGKCTHDEIVNTYDNTIAFTDWFLGQVIDTLNADRSVIPMMIYASDHGESLGEGGLYLHAAPYFMAPAEQTHVPMLTWLSAAAEVEMGVTRACLDQRAVDALSHDNIFHTVLGLLDVVTTARDAALDLTTGCRDTVSG